jgi:hypothetical protein
MTQITYHPMPTPVAEALRAGGSGAYGKPPERVTCEATGLPCRHCLKDIPLGKDMLILAHRPFSQLHPYAETGPIFLCADPCPAYSGGDLPQILTSSPDYLLKGYTSEERIRYGTGRIVAPHDISAYAAQVFSDPDIAFVDVRSARNNCFMLRILPVR